MQLLKQSTAATVLVGPVLDSGGAAVTTAVIGDFNITKNGSTAAMAAAATATHSHNGHYLLALTMGNVDTLGRLVISVNNAAMAMPATHYEVLAGATFDAIVTNASGADGGLPILNASLRVSADTVAISGDSTAADNLEAAYDGTGYSFSYQQAAREAHRCAGTVWHLAANGDDGNDGLSWASPKLTIKTVVEAASAGDLVLIGAGSHAETTAITIPAGVHVRGAGIDTTTLNCRMNLASLVRVSDLSLSGRTFHYATGTTYTDAVLMRVECADNDDDGIFMPENSTLKVFDSRISAKWDAVMCATGSTVEFFNCALLAIGPSASLYSYARAINAVGTVRCFGCRLLAQDGESGAMKLGTHTISVADGGRVEIYGGSAYAKGTGTPLVIKQTGTGVVVMAGVEYDRIKISAATAANVIDIARAVTDTSGRTTDINSSAILADTNELQTDLANGGRVDLILDGLATADQLEAAIWAQTRFRFSVPERIEIPESGSVVYTFGLDTYNTSGALADCTGTPTVTAQYSDGSSASARLGVVTNVGTGKYRFTFTINFDDANPLWVGFYGSGTQGGDTIGMSDYTWAVDDIGISWTEDDRTKLTTIHNKLPSRDYLAGSGAATGETQTDAAAAFVAYDPPTNAEMEARTKAAADYADKTTLDEVAADVADLAAAVSLGTGARAVTITVTDGTDPIEGVTVRVTCGAISRVGTTDESGVIVFSVDDGTWTVTTTKSGYSSTPEDLVVSDDTPLTVVMTAAVIPGSNPGFVTGYLYCYDENGVVESGVKVYSCVQNTSGSGVAFDSEQRMVTSDASGLASFSNMVPSATYRLKRGTGPWHSVTIPASATDPYELPNIIGVEA